MLMHIRRQPLDQSKFYAASNDLVGMGAGNPQYFTPSGLVCSNPTYYAVKKHLVSDLTKAGYVIADRSKKAAREKGGK